MRIHKFTLFRHLPLFFMTEPKRTDVGIALVAADNYEDAEMYIKNQHEIKDETMFYSYEGEIPNLEWKGFDEGLILFEYYK